jgi:hypothetical protein
MTVEHELYMQVRHAMRKVAGLPPLDDPINELKQQIGHALRRAAGLPPLKDPVGDIMRPDELHLPWLGFFVASICGEQLPTPDHVKRPRVVAKQLEKIRYKLRDLQRLIAGLDEPTNLALQWAGSTENKAFKKALETIDDTEDLPPVLIPTDYVPLEEYQEWDMQIVQDTFARLDAAAAEVEKELTADAVRKVAKKPSGSNRGNKQNLNKRNVAVCVAGYIRGVTGNVPTFWKSKQPSGPFAKALVEIFKLLHLSHGIDRAAEQAIAAIKDDQREIATNEWFIKRAPQAAEEAQFIFRKAALAAGLDGALDEPESA